MTLKKGETIELKVSASGAELTYQWQYSKDNGTTWVNCKSTGFDASTFSFNATAGIDGRLYRCVVTGAGGTTESTPIPVKVSTLAITAQPKDAEVGKGQTVDMTVKASGKDLTYQWQYSKDNGETWVDCKSAGYDTAALSFKGTATMNGRQFRCVVTDAYDYTETSAAALVKVSTTAIDSRTAFGLPGRLTISVLPRMPLTARESMARGVMVMLWARIASAMPGASLSSTARVASGVTSRGAKPVPPVVKMTSAPNPSASSTSAF